MLNWDMSASPPAIVGKEVTDGQEAEAGNELGGGPGWQRVHWLRLEKMSTAEQAATLVDHGRGEGVLVGIDAHHQALETWVLSLGPVLRWGIEGASGLGRHTALYLLTRAQDVRDVWPQSDRGARPQSSPGQSDTLDAERIARELLAHPDLPLAFKRSQQAARPDQVEELLGLWHQARRSLLKSQQHLLNEIIGAKRLDQLQDNLAAVELTLTQDELRQMDEVSALPLEYPGWALSFQAADRLGPSDRWERLLEASKAH